MGLEGMVSKRADRPYRGGRSIGLMIGISYASERGRVMVCRATVMLAL
jgi:ATP-dependent DNA ligase